MVESPLPPGRRLLHQHLDLLVQLPHLLLHLAEINKYLSSNSNNSIQTALL